MDPISTVERTALHRARRLFPELGKGEVVARLKRAARLGRGRPPADLAGLAPLTHKIDMTRSAGSLVRAMACIALILSVGVMMGATAHKPHRPHTTIKG
jgi:hypothetical protein